MTITDNYDSSTALTSYYIDRTARATARHWALEKLIHDLAAIGLLNFFEGSAADPMSLTGASETKLWLDSASGVTTSPGTFKRYTGIGVSTDSANWEDVTPATYLVHIGGLSSVSSVADYASRDAAAAANIESGVTYLRTAGYYESGDGGAGLYDKVASEPGHGGKFQSADGAWWELANFDLSVKQFGAKGDGTTDDTTAINNALSLLVAVYFPPGSYRTTATIVMNSEGQAIYGNIGGNDTVILADHVAGPVVDVRKRQCVVSDITLSASDTRNTTGAVTSDNHGLRIGSVDGSGYVTSGHYFRLVVTRQPANAVHMVGEGVSTVFDQVQCVYNRGHGFFFDDGTYDSLATRRRCGIVNLMTCRSVENGGNAVAISPSGQSSYRFLLQNLEAFDNAWNTGVTNYTDAQLSGLVQNLRLADCAFGDDGFADTTMANGDARSAKGSAGISCRIGSNSTDFFMENTRHIGTSGSLLAFNDIDGIYVKGAYTSSTQSIGYDIGTGCSGVYISLADVSDYTIVVDSETTGGRLISGDDEGVLIAGSNNAFFLDTETSATMASASINALSDIVSVTGEGDAADSLQVIAFAGGAVRHPNGSRLTLLNKNAYTITIVDGTDIKTKSGSNVSLTQDQAISFVISGSVAYEV